MAVERKITKDITSYETKIIFSFTARQVLCLVPIVAIILLCVFGLSGSIPAIETRLTIPIPFVVPFILIGWVKIYKQPIEKFIKATIVSSFLSPAKRKYKSERLDGKSAPLPNKKAALAKVKKKSKNKKLKAYH